jgi:hypothetical protein
VSSPQEVLASLAGQTMPGGCEDCDATQTVAQDPIASNLFVLKIEHDDSCPNYRQLRRKGLAR